MLDAVPPEADSPAGTRIALGRGLLASAALLGGMAVLVKLGALAKDWLVARRFGTGDELDAFLMALVIPSYAVAVLGHSFALAFMPTYLRAGRDGGVAAAKQLMGGVLAWGSLVLVAITLALALGVPWLLPLVAAGFDEAKLELARTLFYFLSAVIVASGLSNILAAALNAHERFVVAAAAPLAVPVATVVVFWLGQERMGIYALAVGTTLGFVLETIILALATYRLGLLARPGFTAPDASLRNVGSQYSSVAAGMLLMSSALVVDQSMAASLESGSVSVLSYGGKVVALVLSIVAVSLSTVLFPRFSRLIAGGEWDELERMLGRCYRWVLAASIPAVALLAVFSEPLVRLIFERGAFTPRTTAAVSQVQLWLLPQIPFYVLTMIGYRLLSALEGNSIVLRLGALNLAMNVGGNYLFMHFFGVRGIAMSTSLMYLVAALATYAAIRLKLADVRPRG